MLKHRLNVQHHWKVLQKKETGASRDEPAKSVRLAGPAAEGDIVNRDSAQHTPDINVPRPAPQAEAVEEQHTDEQHQTSIAECHTSAEVATNHVQHDVGNSTKVHGDCEQAANASGDCEGAPVVEQGQDVRHFASHQAANGAQEGVFKNCL
jgi:hypothetical protein